MLAEVAAPRSRHEVRACTETMKVVLQNPMPMPIASDPAPAHNGPDSGVIITSSTLPAISDNAPITAVMR